MASVTTRRPFLLVVSKYGAAHDRQEASTAVSGHVPDETPDNKIGDEKYTERKTAKRNKQTDAQDEHDPNDIGPKTKSREEKSQLEGPAAYAPHDKSDNVK